MKFQRVSFPSIKQLWGKIQVLFGFQCLTKAISTLSVENFVHILQSLTWNLKLKRENVYRLQDIHSKHTVSKKLAYNTNTTLKCSIIIIIAKDGLTEYVAR